MGETRWVGRRLSSAAFSRLTAGCRGPLHASEVTALAFSPVKNTLAFSLRPTFSESGAPKNNIGIVSV